jgi:integrase
MARGKKPAKIVAVLLNRFRPSEVIVMLWAMLVRECQEAMNRAAKIVGMPRITHHDLRHLFATRCIESGVDIPTVSRWLGHKDGGALAMKVKFTNSAPDSTAPAHAPAAEVS